MTCLASRLPLLRIFTTAMTFLAGRLQMVRIFTTAMTCLASQLDTVKILITPRTYWLGGNASDTCHKMLDLMPVLHSLIDTCLFQFYSSISSVNRHFATHSAEFNIRFLDLVLASVVFPLGVVSACDLPHGPVVSRFYLLYKFISVFDNNVR